MKFCLAFLITTLVLLCACNHNEREIRRLQEIEGIIEAKPDSAYALLTAMDDSVESSSERVRMKHRLLLIRLDNKLYNPLPSDNQFQKIVDYFDSHGSRNEQMLAHYLKGCIFRDQGQAPKALQCYQEAINRADTLAADCDFTVLYCVYGQIAMLYYKQYMPEKAIEAWERYSQYAKKAGDTYNFIRGHELSLTSYFFMNDTTSYLREAEECAKLYRQNGMVEEAVSMNVTPIFIHLLRKEYEEARKLMNEYETLSGLFDAKGNICEGREHYYYNKGLYYVGVNKLDSAENYFRRLFDYNYNYEASKGLLYVYQHRKDIDSVLKYSELCEKYIDKVIRDDRSETLARMSAVYDYSQSQQIAAEKTLQSSRLRQLLLTLTIVTLITGTIAYQWYRRYKTKKEEELEHVSASYAKLRRKHERIKGELAAQTTDNQRLRDNQVEAEKLKQQLDEYRQLFNNYSAEKREGALLKSKIVKSFKQMAIPKFRTIKPDQADWNRLIFKTRQFLPSFCIHIFDQNILTRQEMYTCLLLRLKFKNGEIANLLETSPQRISNIKSSITRKLFQSDDASILTPKIMEL